MSIGYISELEKGGSTGSAEHNLLQNIYQILPNITKPLQNLLFMQFFFIIFSCGTYVNRRGKTALTRQQSTFLLLTL